MPILRPVLQESQPKLKLVSFEGSPIEYDLADGYKRLWTPRRRATALFTFSDGSIVHTAVHPGLLTDKRSGSSFLDKIIPKDGGTLYRWGITAHDVSYSGYLERLMADRMLRAVWHSCDEDLSDEIADLGYAGVRLAGWVGYCAANKQLPKPWTNNRKYEYMRLYKC